MVAYQQPNSCFHILLIPNSCVLHVKCMICI
nr:MAG TPA: hypothetical protein [Caudoviricetes sp.]